MSVIANYARLDADALDSCRANSNWLEALDANEVPGVELIDIDKACEGIVWLLSHLPSPPTAHVEGAGFVLQRLLAPLLSGEGGVSEPLLEAGYGAASRLSAHQVAELSDWLQAVDPAQMRSHYDPRSMDREKVYPQIWSREGIAVFDGYLLPHFRVLQAFFSRAARAQQHVLVFFT